MIKNIFFVMTIVMVFAAQVGHADDKGKGQQAKESRPTAQHSAQSRPQPQTRTAAPRQTEQRQAPRKVEQPLAQPRAETRSINPWQQTRVVFPQVHAVVPQAPTQNNRLFHRQHHNNWQPRYNFYNNAYNFYPYVNTTATVDLSAAYISVGFQGENYTYDQGTFYQQDANGQYVAVPPPIGIIVNPIAPQARAIEVDGQVYYRYKGIFYVQVPQGYQVIAPVQADTGES